MGEALTDDERAIFTSLTGREREPGEPCEEAFFVIGRRSGKTRAAAILASYLAALCDHSDHLAPGERGTLPIMSASVWQTGKCFQFLDGIFTDVPALKALVSNRTADTISLSSGVDIECRPAGFRTIRGMTAIAIICDELAYWRSDNSMNPDKEILDAARPSLATTGGLMFAISTPYSRKGELWGAYKRYYGPQGDPLILVAQAASQVLNPTLPQRVIDRAYERDAIAAASEYGAEFRSDIEAFVSVEAVDGAVFPGRLELPPMPATKYHAFVDPSGGSIDSMTLAIAHNERKVAVLDAIRERRPPFSPDDVVGEFVALLGQYRVSRVAGDRYGAVFVQEQFTKRGIKYDVSEKPKSDIYRELLPLLNSKRIELLDLPRLTSQLCGLERRTARGGRDSIDHAPGAHDDVVNSAAGAILDAVGVGRPAGLRITEETLQVAASYGRERRFHSGFPGF